MNILITQSQLFNYSGSEVLTLEVAEQFTNFGFNVTVLVAVYDDPIKADLLNDDTFRVVYDEDAAKININELDLIWVHHSYIPAPIITSLLELKKQGKGPKVIFNHMSYVAPLEIPLSYEIEKSLADTVLFNAQEVQDNMHEKGFIFDTTPQVILGNPAPENFWKNHHASKVSKNITIISNHPPREVIDAAEILQKSEYAVSIIGRVDNGHTERVTPSLINGAGIVISIGKTVQYCIALGHPVYCYDHFGGPGFLNKKNYDKAKYYNFSGRGFEKKTADQIAKDIMTTDLKKQQAIQKNVTADAKKEFFLPERIQSVIKQAQEHTASPEGVSIHYIEQFLSEQTFRVEQLRKFHQVSNSQRAYKNKANVLVAKVEQINQSIADSSSELARVEQELVSIKESKAFKLAHLMRRILFWKKVG